MRQEITVPSYGDEVSEVEISEWHVSVGDSVHKGMVVAELLAEKAAVELHSEAEGKVVEILQPEGAIVKIGDAVLVVESA